MSNRFFIILFLLYSLAPSAQINLVPNPSFELDTACPTNVSQVFLLQNWFKASYSPDFFSACSSTNLVSIPKNIQGYQAPTSGLNYVGLHGGGSGGFSSLRELIAIQLNDTLTRGQKYFFNMSISLADTCRDGINHMGVKFTCLLPDTDANGNRDQLVNNTCQVSSAIIDTNKTTWKRVQGSFVADSNYRYLFLGNFFDQSNTSYQTVYPFGTYYGSYYFIDDVCLSTDSSFCFNYTLGDKLLNSENPVIYAYPNPAANLLYVRNYLKRSMKIIFYDITGKAVYQITSAMADSALDVSSLPNGVYIVELKNHESFNSWHQRIIINN